MTVTAQEDGQETPTATYVSGAAISDPESGSYLSEAAMGSYSEVEMDWSDPRLPSRMLLRFNAEGAQGIHPDGSGVTVRIAGAVRLEGPEGSWSGTFHSLAWTLVPQSGGASQASRTELLMLEGEGDDEGLSAMLLGTGDGVTPAFEGFIFGNTLTMPDDIAPTSE
ncbi:MAG: hypothetical protein R6W93_10755 [Candidatus Limnocylindrales bacterium]